MKTDSIYIYFQMLSIEINLYHSEFNVIHAFRFELP